MQRVDPRRLAGVALLVMLAATGAARGLAEDFSFLPAPPAPAPAEAVLVGLANAGGRVVAVGERGLVITRDETGDWRQAAVPVSTMLTAVDFIDSTHGWAVGHGGVILASDDGGRNWQLQLDGREVNRQFHRWATDRVAALEAELEALPGDAPNREEREYALEDARFALEDAERALQTGPVDPFLDVHFLDRNRGFAVGAYGLLFRTDDGGNEWRIAIDGLDNPWRYHYYDLHERDGVLYLSGEAGLLFVSRDGGSRWRRIEDLYEGSLFGLVDLGPGVAAFGLRGNVFLTEDGGDSWQPVPLQPGASLYGGGALAGDTAVLAGSGGTVIRLAASGESSIYGHPERASFADVLAIGEVVYLAGMGGIARLDEAAPR